MSNEARAKPMTSIGAPLEVNGDFLPGKKPDLEITKNLQHINEFNAIQGKNLLDSFNDADMVEERAEFEEQEEETEERVDYEEHLDDPLMEEENLMEGDDSGLGEEDTGLDEDDGDEEGEFLGEGVSNNSADFGKNSVGEGAHEIFVEAALVDFENNEMEKPKNVDNVIYHKAGPNMEVGEKVEVGEGVGLATESPNKWKQKARLQAQIGEQINISGKRSAADMLLGDGKRQKVSLNVMGHSVKPHHGQ